MRKWHHKKVKGYNSITRTKSGRWWIFGQLVIQQISFPFPCLMHIMKLNHPTTCFFLSFFFFHPLPLFSLAALVHALHVRPSCYYKLLGGLTSLIANTDNGTILTQGLTSAQGGKKKMENMRDFLHRHKKSISPNRCFHLFKSNLLMNTFLRKSIPNRCWINNSRCPFFDSGDYFFGLSPSDMCTCIHVPVHVGLCVCACAWCDQMWASARHVCEGIYGPYVHLFWAPSPLHS